MALNNSPLPFLTSELLSRAVSPSNGPLSGPKRLANSTGSTSLEWVEVPPSTPVADRESSGNGASSRGIPSEVQANRVQPFDQPRRYSPILLKSFPTASASRISFRPLQRWEGVVLEVGPDSFVARLTDGCDDKLIEEAEIDLEEISPEDRELIQEGAVFYWKIEYQDRPSRQRISDIRFRRLPDWTPEQMASAKQEAARVCELIGWK